MDVNDLLNVQHQIKDNSEDLRKYIVDLESWEKEMKQKEEELKLIQTIPKEIPPIRNSLYRPKRKNKHKKQKEKTTLDNPQNLSTDYQSWGKFDAEAEIQKIDEEEKQSSASETSENEEDYSVQHRQQLAQLHKDKGNHFFKTGNYDSAINSYTTGLQLDPENPLLAANRAMAFLKKEQFQAAENDCTLCLSIDPAYVKAYLRRGTARKNLKKLSLAKEDFSKALELEPENKQAQAELKNLTEMCSGQNACDISIKGSSNAQDLWPQFMGNQPVKLTEISSQEVEGPKITSVSGIHEGQFFKSVENKIARNVENNLNGQKIALDNANQTGEKVENVVPKPHLPPVPVNSFHFLNDWNEITPYPDLRYSYLKQFPPEKFPVFFKHDMEPTIFPKIIETLSTAFIEYGDDVYNYMKYLSEIGRFQTMIMFLTEKEENDLKKLFDYIKRSGKPESEVSSVLKKYGA